MQFCMRALRRVVLTSIALALAMFVVPQAHGQAGSVAGTVVDSKSGQPLADAQILVEGSDTRTRTNIRGEFRINAAVGARLVITRVGYQAQTVAAATDTQATARLCAATCGRSRDCRVPAARATKAATRSGARNIVSWAPSKAWTR